MAEPGESVVPVLEVVSGSDEEVEEALRGEQELPEAMPVLPLRDTVAYPDTLAPLGVGQERSIKLVDDVLAGNRMLVMVASRDPEEDTPSPDQLHGVGVVGVVTRMLKVPDGTIRVLVQGSQRVRLGDFVTEKPYLVARITEMPDVIEETPELEALTRNVQKTFSDIIEQIPYLPEELQLAVTNVDDPSALSHLIAGALRITTDEKQLLLEEVDVAKRLRMLSEILARELEVIQGSLRRSLQEVRATSSGLLLPHLGELTVAQTIDHVVRGHQRRTATTADVTLGDVPEQVPLATKIALYRIVQEALNNVSRHANGTRPTVSIAGENGHLRVEVADNGPGFALLDVAGSEAHLGLVGMRERAESLGGQFQVESAPGQGTRVIAMLPLDSAEAHDG